MEELDKCTLDVESGIQLKLNPEPRDGDQKARTQVGHVPGIVWIQRLPILRGEMLDPSPKQKISPPC